MAAQNFSLSDAYYYYEQRMINISRAMHRHSMLWVDTAGYPPNFAANSTYAAFPGKYRRSSQIMHFGSSMRASTMAVASCCCRRYNQRVEWVLQR